MIGQAVSATLFYLLAATVVSLAIIVVRGRQLLRAAISLMVMLALSAGFYIMLHAELLAGVQILVYVGGIVVLMLFAIMLTRSSELLEDHPAFLRQAGGAAASLLFCAFSVAAILQTPFALPQAVVPPMDATKAIGHALLDPGATGYLLPFELISIVLLVAVVGGSVIARKTPPPHQPFTTGGDREEETIHEFALSQREEEKEGAGV